jgi:hypothetical protein
MKNDGYATENDNSTLSGEPRDYIRSLQRDVPQSRATAAIRSDTSIASATERGGWSLHGSLFVLIGSRELVSDNRPRSVTDKERERCLFFVRTAMSLALVCGFMRLNYTSDGA